MASKCPPKQIMRKGYTTKAGMRVKPTCVKDMGKPGKGKPVWRMTPGGMEPYKIVNRRTGELYSSATRHTRLRKAYVNVTPKGRYSKKGILIARLNALRNYNANSNTERGRRVHAAIGEDIDWARRNLS